GGTEPAAEVIHAADALRDAQSGLSSLSSLEPARPEPIDSLLDPFELRRMADALAQPGELDTGDLETRVESLRGSLRGAPGGSRGGSSGGSSAGSRSKAASALVGAGLLGAGLLGAGGIVLVAGAHKSAGIALLAVAAVAAVAATLVALRARSPGALWARRPGGTPEEEGRLRDAEAALAAARLAHETALQNHHQTAERAGELGIEADPDALRNEAQRIERARSLGEQHARWQEKHAAAKSELETRERLVTQALVARGAGPTGDADQDLRRYRDECAARAQRARQSARRGELVAHLADRQAAETQVSASHRRLGEIQAQLVSAAAACGAGSSPEATAEMLAEGLAAFLLRRHQQLGELEESRREEARLSAILEGRSLEELAGEATQLRQVADDRAGGLSSEEIAAAAPSTDPDGAIRLLRGQVAELESNWSAREATLRERSAGTASVPEAEEAFFTAKAHLERLRKLEVILGRSRDLLVQAQDAVHRSIAPQLAQAISPRLSAVTAGRYTDVKVDPENLNVLVRGPGGEWRDAALLSHGTAEQVYLLLRAVLAQYLVKAGESCPLVLDDPTAYADAVRTTAVLETLHHLSQERQVVVFSHDDRVRAWARESLSSWHDLLIELPEPDAGLPIELPEPDAGLPIELPEPDAGLPIELPEPDAGLPID
ncbi:MAG: hypothetical protein ACRDZ5_07785, partial [Acidimicrobiales bacterium]